jgi:hypothetical protein
MTGLSWGCQFGKDLWQQHAENDCEDSSAGVGCLIVVPLVAGLKLQAAHGHLPITKGQRQ